MTKSRVFATAALAALLVVPATRGQEAESLSLPFSDPARPGTLQVQQTHGSITVEGYDGSEVVVESVVGSDDDDDRRETDGLKRWGAQAVQLELTEENNWMRVEAGGSWSKTVDLKIRVPRKTNLQLQCVHSGDIVVRGVEGEHEMMNTHGSIEAMEIGGSLVAETTHGDVRASFRKVAAGRPMAFSTFHGDVDVTFPPDLRAEVRIDPGNGGEVYTAFDIRSVPEPPAVSRERDGRRVRVAVERGARGTINGGGPEMHFKTWSGEIYIRKAG